MNKNIDLKINEISEGLRNQGIKVSEIVFHQSHPPCVYYLLDQKKLSKSPLTGHLKQILNV